jgi:uncharacterized protein with LGFP repeats
VYWTGASGAHPVSGGVRDQWSRIGWENSSLGYPTGDAHDVPGGAAQDFQRGAITAADGRSTVAYR